MAGPAEFLAAAAALGQRFQVFIVHQDADNFGGCRHQGQLASGGGGIVARRRQGGQRRRADRGRALRVGGPAMHRERPAGQVVQPAGMDLPGHDANPGATAKVPSPRPLAAAGAGQYVPVRRRSSGLSGSPGACRPDMAAHPSAKPGAAADDSALAYSVLLIFAG